jgi:hypothetical protein
VRLQTSRAQVRVATSWIAVPHGEVGSLPLRLVSPAQVLRARPGPIGGRRAVHRHVGPPQDGEDLARVAPAQAGRLASVCLDDYPAVFLREADIHHDGRREIDLGIGEHPLQEGARSRSAGRSGHSPAASWAISPSRT